MGLGVKILLVTGVIAYLYRDKIFGIAKTADENTNDIGFVVSTDIGKAVKGSTDQLYKISWQGFKVKYENNQAYLNDGSPEILQLTDTQLALIPETTNAMYYEIGGYRQSG